MTELLQQVIAEIAKLSDDRQDAIASRLISLNYRVLGLMDSDD